MEEREVESRGAGCAIVGVMLMFLPVLYVLGYGPVTWLGNRYPNSTGFLDTLYYPLFELSWNCLPLRSALHWYGEFWR
jgi:hypothetical protein